MSLRSESGPSRRELLGAVAAVGLAGCQRLEQIRNPRRFDGGPADWTPGTDEVPADAWPMARHDARQSGAAPRSQPPDPPLEREWTVTVGDGPVHTPVAADGRVFAAARHPDGQLRALDADTGEQLWDFETGQFLTGSPAVTGSTVAIHDSLSIDERPEVVRAFDAATGDQRWEHELDRPGGRDVLATAGTVYVAAEDRLVALDAETGTPAWQFTAGAPHRRVAAAAVGPRLVYAAAHTDNAHLSHTDRPVTGTVVALDPVAEAVEWSVDLTQPTAVAVAGDRILVQDRDALVALERSTGDRRWERPLARPAYDDDRTLSRFAVSAGTVYHQTTSQDGATGPSVAAVALADGTVRDRYDLAHADAIALGPFLSVAGGTLYAVTWTGTDTLLDVLDLEGGERIPVGPLGLDQAGAPAVAGGSLYLGDGAGSVRSLG